jgi:hypothetical protein
MPMEAEEALLVRTVAAFESICNMPGVLRGSGSQRIDAVLCIEAVGHHFEQLL